MVATTKNIFSKKELSEERIRKLDSISPQWFTEIISWDEKYYIFSRFYILNGKFPKSNEKFENKNIGSWRKTQKEYYRKGKLSQERIEKLDNISPSWKN